MYNVLSIFRIFRRMDDDGNKQLNLEEFTKGLKESGLDISDDEINEIFQKFDTDGNGNLSVDEFIVAVRVSILLNIKQTEHINRRINFI